ncbi:3'-5' exonuclease [Eggerthella sinensis]|uniref:3'-5' exonuclease n=1 Tax=Eggerthella sinensis TaxID=242230 RepID=UPI00266DBB48|nr:exonuclease domain-containing protein [Eggerthella sinensis]
MDGYVFLDVEWADAKRHICSIAYQRTDRAGTLLDTSYQLVNPQCEFEPMLQNVHRITEEMVLGAPTFDIVWNRTLGSLVSSNVIVAHCAKSADCPAIYRSLQYVGITMPALTYIDTGEMAKSMFGPKNYKLPTCCDYYGIRLDDHHDALCDANACRELFWRLAEDVGMPSPQLYTFGGSSKSKGDHFRSRSREVPQFGYSGYGSEDIPSSVEGMSIVLTGDFSEAGYSRNDAIALLESNGARSPASVSKGTAFVVAGSAPGKGKIQGAQKLGKKIYPESFFTALAQVLES